MKKEKSELEGRKYWKEKAERLQRENIGLKNRLDAYKLALNIWSGGKSELIMGEVKKGGTPEKVGHEEFIQYLMEENKKLKEEKELLKQCLDKLMFDADVVNVKIHGELGDYVYVRSDKQFKLNVKD